jgi:hypothetical protein
VAGERADVGASTAGDRGREVGGELIGGVGRTEREASARARGWCRQTWPMGQREREGGESARVGADRRGPPVRHRGHAGAGAGLGLVGQLGLNWVFYFPGNF